MRIEPDLLTGQLVAPAAGSGGADTDRTFIVPGPATATLAPRLDRIMLLDLGIGALAYGADDTAYDIGEGRVKTAGLAKLHADSVAIEPQYLVEPGAALAPPATRGANLAVPASAGWPLRARALRLERDPLSGSTVNIESARGASRLLCVIGGVLYGSTAAGSLTSRTSEVSATGTDPTGAAADVTYSLNASGSSLTPGFFALELAAGARDWSLTGAARSTTTRARAELDVGGFYWLVPVSDLSGRRLPTSLLAVRLKGAVGAPPRRVLRATVGQRIPVPDAAGVWSGAQVSRNPAAVLRAFALGWYDTAVRAGGGPAPTGALLAGTGRPGDTVDHDNLARFYRFCEEHKPPLRCDLWLQDDSRPADAVERLIAACGRADISWKTGRLGVVWGAPDDEPVGLVAPANVLPGSLAIAWKGGDIPDVIAATYLDRNGWAPKEVRVAVPGRSGAVRERPVRLEGVTEAGAAAFLTAAIAAEEAYHRRLVSWRSGRAGAMMTRGSVWLMAADLLSGGLTGRLRTLGESEVRLDRAVRIGGRTWLAIDAPGAPLHRSAVIRVPGEPEVTDRLVLAEPHPALGSKGAHNPRDAVWRLYDLDLSPQPVRIVANRPLSESEFEIVARDERREFWTFLDNYRETAETPPDSVTLRGDQTWQWPEAWTGAGIVDAQLVLFSGQGGQGGQGGSGCRRWGTDDEGDYYDIEYEGRRGGTGAVGGQSTARFQSGGVVAVPGGPGGAGGYGSVYYGRNGSAGSRNQSSRTIRSSGAPIVFDFGNGGAGGWGGARARRNCGSSGNQGYTGGSGYAFVRPLPP